MIFPKARALIAGLLFLGWLGFLAYLVAITRDPVIVSRPQLLVCDLCVVAEVKSFGGRPGRDVVVTDVLWSADADELALRGQPLTIEDLPDVGAAQGWRGPGRYVLPLTKDKRLREHVYRVTPLPPMPGYHAPTVTVELASKGDDPAKTAELVSELAELDAVAARHLVDQTPHLMKRNVPFETARAWQRRLEAIGALARLRESETRIYRAVPDAIEQVRRIK